MSQAVVEALRFSPVAEHGAWVARASFFVAGDANSPYEFYFALAHSLDSKEQDVIDSFVHHGGINDARLYFLSHFVFTGEKH